MTSGTSGLTEADFLRQFGTNDSLTIGPNGSVGATGQNIQAVLTQLGLEEQEANELAAAFEGMTLAEVFDVINSDIDTDNYDNQQSGIDPENEQAVAAAAQAVENNLPREKVGEGEARALLGQVRISGELDAETLSQETVGARGNTIDGAVQPGEGLQYAYTDPVTGEIGSFEPSAEQVDLVTTVLEDGVLQAGEVTQLFTSTGPERYALLETVLRGLGMEAADVTEIVSALNSGDLTEAEITSILSGQAPEGIAEGQESQFFTGQGLASQDVNQAVPAEQQAEQTPTADDTPSLGETFTNSIQAEIYGSAFTGMERILNDDGNVNEARLQQYLEDLGLQQTEAAFLAVELTEELNGITDRASFEEVSGTGEGYGYLFDEDGSVRDRFTGTSKILALTEILSGGAIIGAGAAGGDGDSREVSEEELGGMMGSVSEDTAEGTGLTTGGGLRTNLAERAGENTAEAVGVAQDGVLEEQEMVDFLGVTSLDEEMATESSGDIAQPNSYDLMRLLVESLLPPNIDNATVDQIMAFGLEPETDGDQTVSMRNFIEKIQALAGTETGAAEGTVLTAEAVTTAADILQPGVSQTQSPSVQAEAAPQGATAQMAAQSGTGFNTETAQVGDSESRFGSVGSGTTGGWNAEGLTPGGPADVIDENRLETLLAETFGETGSEADRVVSAALTERIMATGITSEQARALLDVNNDGVIDQADNANGALTQLATGEVSTENAEALITGETEQADPAATEAFLLMMGLNDEQAANTVGSLVNGKATPSELIAMADTDKDGVIRADSAPAGAQPAGDGDLTETPPLPETAGEDTTPPTKSFAEAFGAENTELSEGEFLAFIAPSTNPNNPELAYDPEALKALLKLVSGDAIGNGALLSGGAAANTPDVIDQFVDQLTAEQSEEGATPLSGEAIFGMLYSDTDARQGQPGAVRAEEEAPALSGASLVNLNDLTGQTNPETIGSGEGEFRIGGGTDGLERAEDTTAGSIDSAVEEGGISQAEFDVIFAIEANEQNELTTPLTQSEAEDVFAQILMALG